MPQDHPWQRHLCACNSFSTLSPWQLYCKHSCSVPFEALLYRFLTVVVSVVITKTADEQFNEREYS